MSFGRVVVRAGLGVLDAGWSSITGEAEGE
jgi:hypothetical protein